MESCEIYGLLELAQLHDASVQKVHEEAQHLQADFKKIAALLRFSHEDPELQGEIIDFGRAENLRRTQRKIEMYAISYVADLCLNDCSYCGLSTHFDTKRTILSREELQQDITAAIATGAGELCILAGEHPEVTPEYLAYAARFACQESSLQRLTFNVAPLRDEGFQEIRKATSIPLQYRLFQETYDPEVYARHHMRGPKRDFTRRYAAQKRALQAGFDDVGLGVLLGLNQTGIPYDGIGHDFEILSLIQHAYEITAYIGRAPRSISLPRIQPVEGISSTPQNVDNEQYILYHALLSIALPHSKLITTRRETIEMLDKLRPFIGIEDLAPRPGVGGNIRPTRFQNELSDPRTAQEILQDLRAKGYTPILVE
jgi:2-iminoacetate synthase